MCIRDSDTPGAYPGVGAEERGQAEAIAKSIECSMQLTVPTLSIIIGEGGSGGAIALASSSKVLMLDNVRDAINRNLSKFLTLNEDEILNQRKNKFLDIGRNKGFSTNAVNQDKLTIKYNLVQNLISKIKLNKKLFISITSIVVLLILLTVIF